MSSGIISIVKNTFYLMITRATASFFKVIYAIALAKYLGPELYGMFNVGVSWYLLFLPISLLGLDSILIREIGRNKGNSLKLIANSLAIRSTSSLFIAITSFFIGYLLENDPTAKILLFIFSIALFGRGLSLWVNSIFTANEASFYVFKLETSFRLLEIILGLIALSLGGSVISLALIHAISWVIQGFFGFYLVRKYFISTSFSCEFKPILALISQGFPFVLAGLLSSWLLQGGIFIIRAFEEYSISLGMYTLGLQALLILGGVFSELGKAALPVLSRSFDRGDGKGEYYVDVILRSSFLIGGGLSICGLTIGPELIEWVLGPSYLPVTRLLPWFLFFIIAYFLMNNLNSVIVSMGQYNNVVWAVLCGSLIFTVLAWPLYLKFGELGVVWATGLGLFSVNVVQIMILKKKYHINLFSSLMKPFLVVILSLYLSQLLTIYSEWFALLGGVLLVVSFSILFKLFKESEVDLFKRYFVGKLKFPKA